MDEWNTHGMCCDINADPILSEVDAICRSRNDCADDEFSKCMERHRIGASKRRGGRTYAFCWWKHHCYISGGVLCCGTIFIKGDEDEENRGTNDGV